MTTLKQRITLEFENEGYSNYSGEELYNMTNRIFSEFWNSLEFDELVEMPYVVTELSNEDLQMTIECVITSESTVREILTSKNDLTKVKVIHQVNIIRKKFINGLSKYEMLDKLYLKDIRFPEITEKDIIKAEETYIQNTHQSRSYEEVR